MADSRLPDVVPAKDLASGKETGDLFVVGFCGISASNCDSVAGESGAPSWRGTNPMNPAPPIVKIWSGNNDSTTNLSTHPDEEEDLCRQDGEHRSASQLSDSGIDSQLTSPTVIDSSYNSKLQEQAFVLDLSATHLSVPSRLKRNSLQSCHDKQHPLKEDEPIAIVIENPIDEHGDDPSSGFLPPTKRHHRNFLPLDCNQDGWPARDLQKQHRSPPSEPGCEQQMDADESHLTSSWSEDSASSAAATAAGAASGGRRHQTSPHICVHRDIQERCVDNQSVLSEQSISFGSNESSHFLADHETDPGSYASSRKPSFGSVRSECGAELMDNKRRSSAAKLSLSSQRHHHPGMLSRSSSSRSTFLSVPCRVPNSLWLSSGSDHLNAIDGGNKQSERQHSLHSHLGSTSSLMASRFSLSNPYLRLGLAEAGINEDLLVRLSREEGDDYAINMFDEAYYERSTQLSLTQRLAFPQLVEINPEASSKPTSRYQQSNQLPRDESSLNFFAKIITFLVLVFVIVLVVGVLVKISHTPR